MDVSTGLDYVRNNSRDDYRRAMVDDQRCIVRFEVLSAGPAARS